ncbi:MAG: hypothetical protein HZC12_08980 [Nitrospirae bacterium]|nr:hypothetical protein [Nitrospirota bacterium]
MGRACRGLRPLFFILYFLLFTPNLDAAISVNDQVCKTGKEILLEAEVKRGFIRSGGERVEFFVNNKSIGRTLSGGDGYAFFPFVPEKEGIYKIKVKVRDEDAEGMLLSIKPEKGIVVIDVEGSIFEFRYIGMKSPRPGASKAIKRISRRYHIVYLWQGMINKKALREWLEKYDIPVMPLLNIRSIEDLKEQGFFFKAVIGGPAAIELFKDSKTKLYSFEDIEGSTELKDWDYVRRVLK